MYKALGKAPDKTIYKPLFHYIASIALKDRMKTALLFYISLGTAFVQAQLPYTETLFGFRTEKDIVYDLVPGFAGPEDTLRLDIYKPLGDDNCRRPCLVLVHGGAWIGGSKEDLNMVNIATEMARKGWVVAAINYRLGTHKNASHITYALCTPQLADPCGYTADTAEVVRACYRGQQDAKSALRFMKARFAQDSVDIQNVFIAGESAGAFIALEAAFMNSSAEKPVSCGPLADAPQPSSDLVACLPAGYSLQRPDLGPVEGIGNTGSYNADVQGAGSFYGGIINEGILANTTLPAPVVYLYHQGSDVVVNYAYGRLLGRLDWECFAQVNLCQPFANYPVARGGKGTEQLLALQGITSPQVLADIIENYEYMNDCFDNGHSIDNWLLRTQHMADLFARRIADNGNVPGSGPACALAQQEHKSLSLRVFPNPSGSLFYLGNEDQEPLELRVYDSRGICVKGPLILPGAQNTPVQLTAGIYILHVRDIQGNVYAFRQVCIP